VAEQINQRAAGEDDDLGEDLVGGGVVVVRRFFAAILESWVGAVQGGNCGLQGNVEHYEGWMVRLDNAGERQYDFCMAHVVGSMLERSVWGDLVPMRLARAAPALWR